MNKVGIGLPSRVSEPVAALDPAEKARLKSKCFSFFRMTFKKMIAVDPIAKVILPRPPEGEENKKPFTGSEKCQGGRKQKQKTFSVF